MSVSYIFVTFVSENLNEMKLAVITHPSYFVEEDKILTALFDEGLEDLHLHKPDTSPLFAERLLSLLPENVYRKITVHENYYLCQEYKLAGIHLDGEQQPVPTNYKGNVSRTCHSLEQLKEMKKKTRYVFLKGAFDNTADNASADGFSAEELAEASKRGLIDRHVYAIGGVNPDNIKMLRDLGFGGVVVGENLWNCFDIHNEQDYKNIIAHFARLYKIIR